MVAITGSVTDYAGRTVDMLAYHGASASGEVLLVPALSGDGEGGRICTGIHKLAQRFVIELFREPGTTTFRPLLGSSFLTEARSGAFRNQADVLSAFARAVSQVRVNLQAAELDDDPDDEKFVDAEAISVTVESTRVAIYVNLISQAGRARQFIFPITISSIPTASL